MDIAPTSAPPPRPFFHAESGAVRFWVLLPNGAHIGAIARRELLHHCFRGEADAEGALVAFETHRAEIEAAVHRRVARGSIEPVLLREADFAQVPGAGAA